LHNPVDSAHRTTAAYYDGKVRQYGATPQGVDWACALTQQLRFVQLLKVCEGAAGPTLLNDVGCGWGALRRFLGWRRILHRFDYLGVDIAAGMIAEAHAQFPREKRRFLLGSCPPRVADYSVASGIFNVRLDVATDNWDAFVAHTLGEMRATSRRGFAFNLMVRRQSTREPAQLYLPDPQRWASFCERELGGRVEWVSAYGLQEETLLVRY
jgi:hypothetical protein